MEKMISTAKKLDTFCKVVNILTTVALVACGGAMIFVAAALIFNLDPDQIGTGYNMLEIGYLRLILADAFVPDKRQIILVDTLGAALAMVGVAMTKYCLKLIRQILAPMIKGEPFQAVVSTNLKKMAVMSIVLGVVSNIVSGIGTAMTMSNLHLEQLMVSEKISAVTLNMQFDLTFLVVAAVLLLLSYVFRYGQELQALSDETL